MIETFLFVVLLVWCMANTIAIKLNKRDDMKGDVLDKMTVKILQIHCQKLNKIEKFIEELEDYED